MRKTRNVNRILAENLLERNHLEERKHGKIILTWALERQVEYGKRMKLIGLILVVLNIRAVLFIKQ
jgi:hypothetical protein